MSDRDLLEALVGDVDRFAREHWGRQPLHRIGAYDASHLLDLSGIEALLLTGARPPTFRLVHDGETLPPDRSTKPTRLGGRIVEDTADLGRIAESVANGATLVLQSLQRTTLPIARFCRSLERATSHTAQANAYLTPDGAAGLAEHHDDHDVVVLQLDGTKDWHVDGLGHLRLAPRDVLYMPAGTRHAAHTQDATSLHLTVGLLTTTVRQALWRALDAAGPQLGRQPLPLGYAAGDRRAALVTTLREAIAETQAILARLDVDQIAETEAERARTRRPALLEGHLTTSLANTAITIETVLRRRRDQPADLTEEADHVVVVLPDRRVRMPAVGRAAVEHILCNDRFQVGDLPGLDDASKVVVARRLCREGLLVVVDP